MCISAIIAGISLATTLASTFMGDKSGDPIQAPQVPELPEQPKLQNQKKAETEVAKSNARDRIRKTKTAAESNPSLLTGSSGVSDSSLNLSKSLLG